VTNKLEKEIKAMLISEFSLAPKTMGGGLCFSLDDIVGRLLLIDGTLEKHLEMLIASDVSRKVKIDK